jgi:type IV pilus assembly protein PilV
MRKHTLHNKQAGMTLVEVLVSLVVVSVGLLGVIGLQLSTVKNNYVALMRSHASALADDIADRMRANRAAVIRNGVYDLTNFGSSGGTGTSQAEVDVRDWKTALAAQLPSGDGDVAVADNGVVTISVRWGERRDRTATTTTTTIEQVTFVTQTVI